MENKIHKDWQVVKLGDVVDKVNDKIKLEERSKFKRFVAGEHIDENEIRITRSAPIEGNEEVIGSAFHMRFKPGHVLYVTRRAYLRKAGIVNFEGICSNVSFILEAKKDKLLQKLLPFILQTEDFVNHAVSNSHGSTNPFLNWKDIASFEFLLPSLKEQEKMVEILWAIENNILLNTSLLETNNNFINLLRISLFTKGLKAKKFKESEIGSIPDSWEVSKVEDVCEILDGKRVPITESERKKGDIPYYGATGIIDHVEGFIFNEKLLLVGEDGADWSANANTSFIIEGKSWVNNHAHVLRCMKIEPYYLREYLNSADLNEYVTGTTRGKLNQRDLRRIKFPLPTKEELDKIISLLKKVEENFQLTKINLDKLKSLRQKLMNELLLGKIRLEK